MPATPSWILSMISQQQSDPWGVVGPVGDGRRGLAHGQCAGTRANVVIPACYATGRAEGVAAAGEGDHAGDAAQAGEEGKVLAERLLRTMGTVATRLGLLRC